jgi:hypothetical protein
VYIVEQDITPPFSVYHRLTRVLKKILAMVKLSKKYEIPLKLDMVKDFLTKKKINPNLKITKFNFYFVTFGFKLILKK